MDGLPFAIKPQAVQPQRICDHRDGAERRGRHDDDWAEQQPQARVQHPGRKRHASQVVDEGKTQFLVDAANGARLGRGFLPTEGECHCLGSTERVAPSILNLATRKAFGRTGLQKRRIAS